jgi:hypothetical protein
MPKRAAPITPIDPSTAERLVVDEAYAKECLDTPPAEALQEDFRRYSADLAWWGERLADARREVALVQLDVETEKAEADGRARESLASKGKVTEDAVKAAVRADEKYVKAQKRLIDTEHFRDRITAIVDALKAKRDMLVGLGATFRAEIQADPVIRD